MREILKGEFGTAISSEVNDHLLWIYFGGMWNGLCERPHHIGVGIYNEDVVYAQLRLQTSASSHTEFQEFLSAQHHILSVLRGSVDTALGEEEWSVHRADSREGLIDRELRALATRKSDIAFVDTAMGVYSAMLPHVSGMMLYGKRYLFESPNVFDKSYERDIPGSADNYDSFKKY